MATIDDRIVRMSFDNRGFESGVSETMSSLEKLKNALNFSKSSSTDLNLSGISSGITQLNKRFSALGIAGMTCMQDITRSAIQMGKSLVDAVSIDAIKDGFKEYELQMDSVKTIMASTGKDIGTVNKYLDELNKYADQTIYSFSDMTRNIGKFTNAGVELEDAVMAIKGIANEAAVSGANANEASRAMYNFAQALSGGSVKLRDWMSIENANMATKEFKQQLIDAGVELGTLAKKSDGTYEVLTTNMNGAKMKETISSTKNFRDSLQYSWMTTEVLTKTLKNYADETTEIGKKAKDAAQDVTTFTKLIETLKEALGSSWNKTFQLVIGDFEEAKKFWTEVSKSIGSVIESFGAARNSMLQIWHDNGGRNAMIDSLRNTWDGLKQVFGVIHDAFEEVFPPMTGEKLIEITNKIKEITSKFKLNQEQVNLLKDSFTGLFSTIKIVLRLIKTSADHLKPIIDILKPVVNSMVLIIASVGRFLTGMAKSDNMFKYFSENIKNIFTDTKEIFREVLIPDFGGNIKKAFSDLIKTCDKFRGKFGFVFNPFSKGIEKAEKSISRITEKIKSFLPHAKKNEETIDKATKHVSKFTTVIESLMSKFKHLTGLDKGYSFLPDLSKDTEKQTGHATKFQDTINKLKESILSFFSNPLNKMKQAISSLGESFEKTTKSITGFFNKFKMVGKSSEDTDGFTKHISIFEKFKKILESFSSFFDGFVPKLMEKIRNLMSNIPKFFKYLSSEEFGDLLNNIQKIFKIKLINDISGLFKSGSKGIEGTFKSFNGILKSVSIGANRLTKSVDKVSTSITKLFDSFSGEGKKKTPLNDSKAANNLIKVAGAIGILTASLIPLAKLEPEQLAIGITGIVLELQILLKAFSKLPKILEGFGDIGNKGAFAKSFVIGKLITNLIKLATAIKVISLSVSSLGQLDKGSLLKGLLGTFAIIEMLLHTMKKLVSINEQSQYGLVSIKAISKGIITFSIGIRILATSVKALGEMDTLSMLQGLVGVLTLLEAINLFTQEAKNYQMNLKSAFALVLTIETIKMMTSAALSLGGLNFGSFIQGLFGVLVLLEAINLFTKEIDSYKLDLKSAAALILTIETIKMMTSAALSLAELDLIPFTQGLAGVLVFLQAINLFMYEVTGYKIGLKSALALILTIETIKMMTNTAISLGSLDFKTFAQGLIGVITLLEAINLFTQEAKKNEMNLTSVAALIITIQAIKMMSSAAIELGSLSFQGFVQGIAGVVIFLQAINLFVHAIKSVEINLSIISALGAISAAISVISVVISNLSKFTTDEILNGLIGLGGSLAALLVPLVVLSKIQNGVIKGAAAMVILSTALFILTPTLKLLGSMEMNQIVIMILGLASAITVLGVSGAILGNFALLIGKGALAILVFGVAIASVGAGMALFGIGLSALSVGITAFAAAINEVKNIIVENIQGMAEFLKESVTPLASIVSSFLTVIFSAIFTSLGGVISENLPKLGKFLVDSFVGLLNSVAEAIRTEAPKILNALANIFESGMELLLTMIQKFIQIITPFGIGDFIIDKIEDLKLGLRERLAPEKMSQIGSDAYGDNGLAGGIKSQEETVNKASSGIGLGSLFSIGNILSGKKSFNIGSLLGTGVSNGMLSTTGLLGDSASSLGDTVIDNLDIDATQYGLNATSTYADGLNLGEFDITKSAENITGDLTNSFENTDLDFEKIADKQVSSYTNTFTNQSTKNTVKKSGENIANEGVSGVDSKKKDFVEVGKDAGRGYADGLDAKDVKAYVKKKAESLGLLSLNTLRKKIDSNSPAKEFTKLGVFGGIGFALGLSNTSKTVRQNAENLGTSALDGMRNALHNLSQMADSEMITDPKIRPVLDLSNIQNGIGNINSMFDSNIVDLKASLAGTGSTVQDLYSAANTMHKANVGNNNNDVVSEMIALRSDVKNLGQAMSQMKMYMDGREVGGIVSHEVDRKLGMRYLRNRREGRA